jgi:tryptophan synthase alpha chain
MNTNRLSQLFASGKKDLLNIYFTAGYPALHDTAVIAEALASAGADIIELGMPYSDPLADGTTIQQSSELAIANGMTMELLFEQVEEIRRRTQIPLVWMGYLNPVMQYGEDRFLQRCAASGIDGLIIPDLPLHEYEASFKSQSGGAGFGVQLFDHPADARIPHPGDSATVFRFRLYGFQCVHHGRQSRHQCIASYLF